MAKRYELVEVDGRFGLLAKGLPDLSDSPAGAYAIFLGAQGQIDHLRSDGRSFYGDYLITRDDFEFGGDIKVATRGTTHYLGEKMTLSQYENTTNGELQQKLERFEERYPDMSSNYERSLAGRFSRLLDIVVGGYKKIEQLSEAAEEESITQLDTQIPGFRAGYEYAKQQTEAFCDRIEAKLEKHLDDKDAQQVTPKQKKTLVSQIDGAAKRAAVQSASPQQRSNAVSHNTLGNR